jgi:hypothetical protein
MRRKNMEYVPHATKVCSNKGRDEVIPVLFFK